MYLSDIFTVTANLAGLPAISVPIGRVKGLPIGGQLVGQAFLEDEMLEAAYALERPSRPARRRDGGRLGDGDRARDARPAAHALEDVLRLSAAFGARPTLTSAPCASVCRGAPVPNEQALKLAVRAALGVGWQRASAQRVRAQELLLPRPAEGLPDLAVRAAARDPRDAVVPVARSGIATPRSSASTSRRMREVAARRFPKQTAIDLNRCGVAAHRDRHRAGFPVAHEARAYLLTSSRCSSTPGFRTATWKRGACAWTRTSRAPRRRDTLAPRPR